MGTKIRPIVYKISNDAEGLKEFHKDLTEDAPEERQNIILQYPIVYIHNWQSTGEYEVYVGESNNIIQRTKQHHDLQVDTSKWQHKLKTKDASLYIIGHKHFNKSLTLDIENRLMHYMMSVERVKMVHNLKGNPQNKYYPDDELDDIFRVIWRKLRGYNKELFPSEASIKDSALFKASPLHKLTEEQERQSLIVVPFMICMQKQMKKKLRHLNVTCW